MAIDSWSTLLNDPTHMTLTTTATRASDGRLSRLRGEWVFALLPIGSIVMLWGLILTAIPADRQDFPLNDDWAYSKGIFALARGEGIHYYRQPSMPLLGQWLLAYPIVRIVGESNTALRLLTVGLSLLGVLAFYDLLRREVGLCPPEASFTAAAIALNPIVFVMSGTFMSDVPALSLSLIALAFYTRALRGGRLRVLLAGAFFATLATTTRQNAVVIPVVAGILLARERTLRWRPAWLVGVGLPLIAGVVVHSWFTARPDSVPLAPVVPSGMRIFVRCLRGSVYLGLSALPVLALRPGIVLEKRFLAAFVVVLDLVAILWVGAGDLAPPHAYRGGLFPYLPNTVTCWGTLDNGIYLVGERPLMMGTFAQGFLTVAGCIGVAALAVRAIDRIGKGALAHPFFLYTALHVPILLVSPYLFDRYLIVLMPGTLVLAAGGPLRLRWRTGLGALALFAVCSVGLMHDWLAWNSARWGLGRRALARGISAEDIEGGYEWDGWYAPGPVADASDGPIGPPRGLTLPFDHFRHPHITGRYALAFSHLPGTAVLDDRTYRLWLVPGEWRFFLLEKPGNEER